MCLICLHWATYWVSRSTHRESFVHITVCHMCHIIYYIARHFTSRDINESWKCVQRNNNQMMGIAWQTVIFGIFIYIWPRLSTHTHTHTTIHSKEVSRHLFITLMSKGQNGFSSLVSQFEQLIEAYEHSIQPVTALHDDVCVYANDLWLMISHCFRKISTTRYHSRHTRCTALVCCNDHAILLVYYLSKRRLWCSQFNA